MKINEHNKLVGQKVILVAYKKYHVGQYHDWMQSKELLEKTASERLTLDKEYEMQQKWLRDEDKCTFIVLNKYQYENTNLSDDTEKEVVAMVGDVNLFFNNEEDRHEAELEVMIAESSARRQGFGCEAVKIMMCYGYNVLGVKNYVVKIGSNNVASINLFKRLGFQQQSHSHVFQETTFSLSSSSSCFKINILGTKFDKLDNYEIVN